MRTSLTQGRGADAGFAVAVAATLGLVLLAAARDPRLGVLAAAALGGFALLALVVGTERGTLAIGGMLLAVTIVLPGDYALAWRIPVGGGGIFAVDLLLALLVASMAVAVLIRRGVTPASSPVNLPLMLLLAWVAVAGVNGVLSGNETKLILQDARALAYYSLFFFVVGFVRTRAHVLLYLRLLGVCLVAVFAIGAMYAARGEGMAVEFVEPGVSRFPAPDDVFLIAAVALAGVVVTWPTAQPRPWWLWFLLLVALLGLVLSFVRGNYVAFVAGLAYLLVVLRTRERFRLLAGGSLVAAALAIGLAVVSPAMLDSVVSRALAVTAVRDRNVQYRLIENRAVGAEIAERPLLGNGLGKDYLFDWSRYGVSPYRKSYIHNSYYWFTHRLGLIGLVLVVWVVVAFLGPWLKDRDRLSRGDPWLTGLVFGSRAALVAVLVVSVTSPRLNGKDTIVVLATLMGLAEVARALLLEGDHESTVRARSAGTAS